MSRGYLTYKEATAEVPSAYRPAHHDGRWARRPVIIHQARNGRSRTQNWEQLDPGTATKHVRTEMVHKFE